MKHKILLFLIALLSFPIILTACNEQGTSKEATPQASLSGTIFLLGFDRQGGWPFANYVELSRANGTRIVGKTDKEAPQEFKFENIEAGIYKLWVLIPSETLSLKNCYDIGLPDSTWKLGGIFGNSKTLAIKDIGYREAFLQALNMHSPDPKTYEFYAVLENLEIKSGIDNNINVNLICKSS